jgi:elongation factor 2
MKSLWEEKNFVNVIIKPIYTILNACQSHPEISSDGKYLVDILDALNIKLPAHELELSGIKLIRCVMSMWLPVAEAVVELVVDHLPSPKISQKYRADLLYKGEEMDKYKESIMNCDSNGPLVIYISKMIPTKDNSRFYAFGRVFSGTAKAGKIKVLTDDHNPKETSHHKTYLNDTIQRVMLMMASKVESIESISAGSILGLEGVDKSIIKSGTIVDENSLDSFPIKNVKFAVSPIVQYALRPKNISELSKFVDQMKKFVKSDPCLQYIMTKEGEHILAGAGELHLDVAIEQLRTDFLKGIEFEKSDPIVPYCETIVMESSQVCLSKSPNKHNRLYFTAQPLDNELVDLMVKNELPQDEKEKVKLLIEKYGFDDAARKIWKLGPEIESCNMILDDTKGVQYLNEIKDSVNSGFINVCHGGPLCDEAIRGIRFNLKDVRVHSDSLHRNPQQILSTTRRVLYACMLTACPKLMEPVFMVEITLPRERVSTIYGIMNKKRGVVKSVGDGPNGNIMIVIAELPVAESFGFVEDLRSSTSGTAFASLSFSHWQIVPGDPMEDGSYANKIMMDVRKRKGLKLEKPNLSDYLDKL